MIVLAMTRPYLSYEVTKRLRCGQCVAQIIHEGLGFNGSDLQSGMVTDQVVKQFCEYPSTISILCNDDDESQ